MYLQDIHNFSYNSSNLFVKEKPVVVNDYLHVYKDEINFSTLEFYYLVLKIIYVHFHRFLAEQRKQNSNTTLSSRTLMAAIIYFADKQIFFNKYVFPHQLPTNRDLSNYYLAA